MFLRPEGENLRRAEIRRDESGADGVYGDGVLFGEDGAGGADEADDAVFGGGVLRVLRHAAGEEGRQLRGLRV